MKHFQTWKIKCKNNLKPAKLTIQKRVTEAYSCHNLVIAPDNSLFFGKRLLKQTGLKTNAEKPPLASHTLNLVFLPSKANTLNAHSGLTDFCVASAGVFWVFSIPLWIGIYTFLLAGDTLFPNASLCLCSSSRYSQFTVCQNNVKGIKP